MRQVHEQLRTALDVAKEAVEAGSATEALARDLRLHSLLWDAYQSATDAERRR